MKLLHIDSSITGPGSVSRAVTAEIVNARRRADTVLDVIHRDLGAEPVGHLSGAHLLAAQGTSPEAPEVRHDVNVGAEMLQEFLAADIIVVGAPMYNFSIPTQLKAWIDRLAVAGATFRYTETGPEGLCAGKQVIIASSRGNVYGVETPNAALDHQETYLRSVFGFLGITDIHVIRAEGLGFGEAARAAALAGAKSEAAALAA